MASPLQSLVINDLPEISFIAGTAQYLYFDVYDTTGSPMNLTSASCSWVMSPYGQPTFVVGNKSGTVISGSSNRFSITINSSESSTWKGKYQHQPVIVDVSGNSFRPSQGVILVIPKIG